MRQHLLSGIFILFFLSGYSQQRSWVELMRDRSVNFYDVQKAFNQWKDAHEEDLKDNDKDEEDGTELYGRWAELMEPRTYPSGVRPDPMQTYTAMDDYNKQLQDQRAKSPDYTPNTSGNWTPLGPVDYNGFNPYDGIGMGRVNGSAVDPTNPNNIFLATPAGGIWRSNNGGLNWATTTDNLPVLSFSHVAVDPTNSNIIYAASGDGEGTLYSIYGLGVLKSTDGGTTWNMTGLNWANLTVDHCHKIIVDSVNSNVVLVGTDIGLLRSQDGGATWVKTINTNIFDLKFKADDHNVVFAVSANQLYRSTNNGQSFVTTATISGAGRLALAVTPANPNYVYIVSSQSAAYGFNGLSRSTDAGLTVTSMSTTPNILGSKFDGSGTGVQGWYDLTIAASPTDANVIFAAGVSIWKSADGGATWSIVSFTNHKTSAPYVHADVHSLNFVGNVLYACTDGGFYKTSDLGTTWTDLSAGLQIAQFYHIAGPMNNPNTIYGGEQDNGTGKYLGNGTWSHVYGLDGFRPLVDYTDTSIVYTSSQTGKFYKSINAGLSYDSITRNGITGTGAWDTPFIMDPVNHNTLYVGYNDVFRSTDAGGSWTKLSAANGANVNVIVVAPSNANYIYYSSSGQFYRSTDAGATWTSVVNGLPALTCMAACVSPTDPLKVWATYSGYGNGSKVFATTDGGTTWTNYTGFLPNLPVNCITYQNGSNDGLYIGMDIGVYYRDNNSANWQPFMTGLPNVMVRDLQINYVNNKIRAGTHGRGVWESDLFINSAPVAALAASKVVICTNDTIVFTDISYNNPTSRSWSFAGGNPGSSNNARESVVYSTPGIYTVTLKISNSFGSDSITKTQYITVTSPPQVVVPYMESFETITVPDKDWLTQDVIGGNKWQLTSAAANTGSKSIMLNNYSGNPPDDDYFITPSYDLSNVSNTMMTFYVAFAEKISTTENKLAVYASNDCGVTWQLRYSKTGATLTTNGGVTVASDYVPAPTEWRKETVNFATTNVSGKPNVKIKFDFVNKTGNNIYIDDINLTGTVTGIGEHSSLSNQFVVRPNPFIRALTVFCNDQSVKNATIEIYNVVGEKVYSTEFDYSSEKPAVINTDMLEAGIYFLNIKSDNHFQTEKIIKIN